MKTITSLLTFVCALFITTATAQINQTVVYDFTNNAWGIKTLTPADPTAETGKKTYTNGDKSFTINARGGRSFYYDNDCLRMDKAGNKLTLPAFDFAVDKIEVTGHSKAASYPNADINIQVGGNAVSTAVAGLTGSNIFEIAPEYQAAGNTFDIVIGAGGGTYSSVVYITYIKVYPAASENALTLEAPVFNNGSGVYTGPVTVAVSSPTAEVEGVEDVVYYYTTDGYEPDAECDEIEDGTITISESCTLKVVLEFTYEGQTYTSESTSAEYIISEEVTYATATEIVTGNYFIAAGNALALPFSKGVLPAKETVSANGYVTDAAYYAYYIEEDGNGNFYIKDAKNQYITATATSSKDDIKTSTTEHHTEWSIIIEDGVAKIRKDGYVIVYKNNEFVVIKEEEATATEIYPSLYTVESDNSETVIENIVSEVKESAIYDLSGRRIENIRNAGIYIVNGKQILVK